MNCGCRLVFAIHFAIAIALTVTMFTILFRDNKRKRANAAPEERK